MIVIDTDVASEMLRVMPDATFAQKMRDLEGIDTYVTSVTFAELRAGVEVMPRGHRRDLLDIQVNVLFERGFAARVLDFNQAAAYEFGEIAAKVGLAALDAMMLDAQIAAIARSRGASVATRNIKHFKLFEVSLFNPWEA